MQQTTKYPAFLSKLAERHHLSMNQLFTLIGLTAFAVVALVAIIAIAIFGSRTGDFVAGETPVAPVTVNPSTSSFSPNSNGTNCN